MNYILVIWTPVGVGGNPASRVVEYGWRTIGEFATNKAAEDAAKQMGIKEKDYRVLSKEEENWS